MRRIRFALAQIAFLALISSMLAWGAAPVLAATGGPVVLMGIDAEDGGPGGHGPVSVYGDVVELGVYNNATGGTGILVIGGGKNGDPSNPCLTIDNVTDFWNALSADTGLPVTYVFGAGPISAVSFAPFRMI